MVDDGDHRPLDGIRVRRPGFNILGQQVLIEDDHVRLQEGHRLREVFQRPELAEYLYRRLGRLEQPDEPCPEKGLNDLRI
ncbi:hypothetical protein MN0502_07540 [Arthrobacter sp. MN05-02]|nr:hypothetical protein MN0502_07540 [Arthrobacter sp. MN05-02]